jgi:hypothetical protein
MASVTLHMQCGWHSPLQDDSKILWIMPKGDGPSVELQCVVLQKRIAWIFPCTEVLCCGAIETQTDLDLSSLIPLCSFECFLKLTFQIVCPGGQGALGTREKASLSYVSLATLTYRNFKDTSEIISFIISPAKLVLMFSLYAPAILLPFTSAIMAVTEH